MSLANTSSPTSQELLLRSPPPLPRGVFPRRPPRPHISQHTSPKQQVPISQAPQAEQHRSAEEQQQHCCAHPAAGVCPCPHHVLLTAHVSPRTTALALLSLSLANLRQPPRWMARSILKHIQLLYLTVACYAHYSIKDFICSHSCNVYYPNSFNSGLLTKCFPSSGNCIHSPKQTLAR